MKPLKIVNYVEMLYEYNFLWGLLYPIGLFEITINFLNCCSDTKFLMEGFYGGCYIQVKRQILVFGVAVRMFSYDSLRSGPYGPNN